MSVLTIEQESRSGEKNQPKQQGHLANRNDSSILPTRKLERKASFKRTLGRAGRSIGVSPGILTALHLGEDPVVNCADKVLSDWKTYLSDFDQKHENMDGAFDSFQDSIEDAFDAKYKHFLGEGRFLIDEEDEASLTVEMPAELPKQEVQVVSAEDADIWNAHRKGEQAFSEVRDVYTGSARRELSEAELVVYPPKPRTFSAGPGLLRTPLCHACTSPCPPTPEPPQPVKQKSIELESTEDDQRYVTLDPVDSLDPMSIEAEMEVGQPVTPSPPAKEGEAKLPRPASHSRSGSSKSGQRFTGRRPSTARPVEEPKPQARKDSTQNESSTKPVTQRRALSRDQERYPKVQAVNRQVKPKK